MMNSFARFNIVELVQLVHRRYYRNNFHVRNQAHIAIDWKKTHGQMVTVLNCLEIHWARVSTSLCLWLRVGNIEYIYCVYMARYHFWNRLSQWTITGLRKPFSHLQRLGGLHMSFDRNFVELHKLHSFLGIFWRRIDAEVQDNNRSHFCILVMKLWIDWHRFHHSCFYHSCN